MGYTFLEPAFSSIGMIDVILQDYYSIIIIVILLL